MSGIAAAALVWTVGGALASSALAAAGVGGRRLALYAVALASAVGCGLASLVYFFALVAGFGRPGTFAFLAVGAAAAAVPLAAARRRWHAPVVEPAAPPVPPPVTAGVAALAWAALAASAFLGGRTLWRLAHVWPEGTWDAVAIWNVRARFLFAGAGEFAALLGRVEPSSHPHYPLFLPGAIAAQYAIAGGEAEWTPRLVALGLTAGLAVLAYAVVADVGSPAAAALAAALVAGTPLVWLWGAAQVADVAVAYLFLAALAVFASQLPGYPAAPLPPLLGGFLLGLLAWVKSEGLVMAAILGALLAVGLLLAPSAADGPRRRWLVVAAVALGALPGLAALVAFKLLWAPAGTGTETFLGGAWADRLADPQRWWMPLRALFARFVPLGEAAASWSLLWPSLLVGLVAVWLVHRGRPRPWLVFWTAALVAVVASWVPIYAITPYDQAWHLAGSIDRLLLQVMPATAVGVVFGAAQAARAEARPSARRAR